MAYQHEGCLNCKFHHVDITWQAPHDFNYSPKFLFVVEQYQSSAKSRLTKLLKNCEFDTSDIEVAFLTRCWAGEGKKGGIKEAQKCFPLLAGLLSKVSKDTIIVPMGAVPCKVVAEAKSIQTAHGTIIQKDGRVVIPTLHPQQVVLYPDSLSTFIADLEVIKKAGKGEFTQKTSVEYEYVGTIEKFKMLMLELWMSKDYVVDIEASSLDAHRTSKNPFLRAGDPRPFDPSVLSLSFSNKSRHAWFLPLDHPNSPWEPKQRDWIVKKLKIVLEAKRASQICHGGDYDYTYLQTTLGITLGNYNFDTLLAHYVAVTEEKGTHYLKILAWEFTDMGGYDDALEAYISANPEADPSKGGSYQNIPLDILFPYACGDADCTYRLYEIFKPLIHEKFYDLYYNIIMPANLALADVQNEGAPINLNYWEYCSREYPRILSGLLEEMRQYPEVIEVERLLQEKAKLQKIKERNKRFKERSNKILILQESNPTKANQMLNRLKADIEKAKRTPVVVKPVIFNPKSPDQKSMLLFDIMGFTPSKFTKEGDYSTDKDVLLDLWIEHGHLLVRLIGRWTKAKTLYSMFIENLPLMLGDDGRLRGSYNLAGTVTGRISCSNPNLQQIPRNLEDDDYGFVDSSLPLVKGLFYAPPGFVIMQLDYSQAELRVLAALTKEPTFLDAFNKDQDIHKRVASELFEVMLEEVTKQQRKAAKNINFGLLYGQGFKKLARIMGWSHQKAKDFINLFYKKLKRIKRWIKSQKSFVRENGFMPTPYGRIRRLATAFSPEEDIVSKAERQSVNSPIQGTASDCMLISLARANKYMRSRGMKSRIIITVHDSVIILAAIEEVDAVYLIMKKIMENPPHNGWLEGIKMKADVEIGKDWGALIEIKKLEDIEPAMLKMAA